MTIKTRFPAIEPTLDLNFAFTKRLDPRITFTRASSGSYVDQYGVLKIAGNNEPRFDHSPTTGESLGLLVEEQRTNSIRNNTMVGAVAGTPGAAPTNWGTFTTLTGITREIVSVGTENGISYVDFRLYGTPSAAGNYQILTESNTIIAALQNQTWIASFYLKVAGGSQSGISSIQTGIQEYSVTPTFLTQSASAVSVTSSITRFIYSRTLVNASTAYTRSIIQINLDGTAIDFTLRIGLPQLEQGAFATSVIPTSGATATRSADVASITGTNFSSWYRQDEGSFLVTGTIPGDALGTFLSVDNNTADQRWQFRRSTPARSRLRFVSTGNSIDQLSAPNAFGVGSPLKMAASATAGAQTVFVNGSNTMNTTATTMPTVTQFSIGSGPAADISSQTISRLAYWPARLPDSTIQALTQ